MEKSKEIYKEKSKQTFSNQATIYESTYNGKHAKKLYDYVIENVMKFKCEKVLDVGCGTGTILSILSKNDSIKLAGVDLSESMISVAKEKLDERVELKIGDSEKLPWEENNFDLVICTDSFHHYPEPKRVLSEMKRVLEPKGRLLIGDPWMIPPLRQISNLLLKYGNSGDYKIYSKAEICELLLASGFNSIKWSRINLDSFIVTAEVNK